MSKKILFIFVFIFALSNLKSTNKKHTPDEGMYPLSEIRKLDLRKAGMLLTSDELFNPNGTSQIDALVQLGGCTASFVSNEGLIITNHHCAFGAVAAASTPEKDFITDGFLANNRSQEIVAKGLTCRITASYEDVSNQIITDAIKQEPDALKRLNGIKDRIRLVTEAQTKQNPEFLCEISEMFIGKTYIVFRYQTIKDVRLVYAPPRSIGEFGGETDNWVWPRHTGDFSFVRAYVSPDGKPTAYSKDNVPYTPKKFLKVNPNGVADGDFVFILGYPGRTFRNYPSQYLEFQRDYQLPYISNIYDWQIDYMNQASKIDDQLRIRFASPTKSLANVTKNYKGKLQGLKRVNIIENKQQEEANLKTFIAQNPNLKTQYGTLFDDLNTTYQDMKDLGNLNLWLGQLYNRSASFAAASELAYLRLNLKNTEKSKRMESFEKQKEQLKKNINTAFSNFYAPMDKDFLVKLLNDANKFEGKSSIIPIKNRLKTQTAEQYINTTFEKTKLQDKTYILALIESNDLDKLLKMKEPLIDLANEINIIREQTAAEMQAINAKITLLLPQFIDLKMLANNTTFVPDANSTLRLTYGNVRGYSPADGIYNDPFTTLKGVLEKNDTKEEDFEMPKKLREIHQKGDLGQFVHPVYKDIPVAFLYNMDTTGGNSGSPVMNAKGELVGVNFDRAFGATINDFAWNEAYSRSIGCDIRYVLFVLDKYANAQHLIKEMGVTKN